LPARPTLRLRRALACYNGTMTDQATDPGLMKVADKVFWDEFNQMEHPGDRYIVIDSKNQQIVAQNVKLITEKRKVRV